ncbi:hypothetical protein K5X82_16085 [Halosquirtibacter xylanolyticus]|uniref:chondroitinase family polysaccharide lyase n=1 Tax=Halosquirtibacter xylanolyticus TaxID=3374599 RepID=UPI003749196B|nr:hypothetical protein K5X82_16085 [Prolixibacteraceae bacterium]
MRNDHHKWKRQGLLLFICFLLSSTKGICANEITYKGLLSFETKVDDSWVASTGSSLSISKYHYKHGASSLKWSYVPGSFIDVTNLNVSLKKQKYLEPTFVCWVYNEHPTREGKMTFQFYKSGEKSCWFDMGMNFKGWRAVWINYEKDMKGSPVDGMDQMKIVAPAGHKGTLYFDHMVLSETIDSRYPTGDYQVPYVNFYSTNHWQTLLKSALNKPNIPVHAVTEQELADLKAIEARFKNMVYSPTLVTPSSLARLRKDYDFYGIRLNPDKSLIGRPIIFSRFADMYTSHTKDTKSYFRQNKMDMKSYASLMYRIACAYVSADGVDNADSIKKELATMFLNLRTHLMDQGWCEGSGMGTLHHLGYNLRSLYDAYFLMRDVLKAGHSVGQAQRDLAWFSGLGEILVSPKEKGISIDAFNTTIMGRLSSILLIDDPSVRVQYLNCFVRYLNNGLALAPGLEDSFKPDGSVFHHANNYPAYATGGYKNACRMVYVLSQTGFAVSPDGHRNLKRSLLMTRLYCNKYVWPLSLSGRHPKGTGRLLTEYYKYMSLAGTPDGGNEIDPDMAGVFLRLVDDADSDPQAQYIVKKGGVAEAFPSGNWTMNYSALSIHRRDNWLVTAHGHSRYLWSSEHYPDANNYGRYLTYGALEVLASRTGSTPSNFTSGFRQWGWDWARIPGTTTIHLPIDSLQADMKKVDNVSGKEEMLLSDEAFCGGLNFEKKYGVWAMRLHQNVKYDASFKARKSVFFFDDKIVCLGSDIQNENSLFSTETTLFQTNLKGKDEPIELNKKEINKFPYEWQNDVTERRDTYLKDNVGNFFYVPYRYNVVVERKHQISRDQSSKYRTENDFATAVINHGNAPSDASYEYVMLVQPSDSEVKHFMKAMRYDDSHPYFVQQNDREAHIVEDHTSNVKGYAFFARNRNVDDELVSVVDMPCLMMSKMEKKILHLSVCDPDLHLYNGPADVQFDDNDNYVERSVYSRDWYKNEGKESKIKITLNGDWSLDDGANCVVNHLSNGKTELIFLCQHGMTNDVKLKKN